MQEKNEFCLVCNEPAVKDQYDTDPQYCEIHNYEVSIAFCKNEINQKFEELIDYYNKYNDVCDSKLEVPKFEYLNVKIFKCLICQTQYLLEKFANNCCKCVRFNCSKNRANGIVDSRGMITFYNKYCLEHFVQDEISQLKSQSKNIFATIDYYQSLIK